VGDIKYFETRIHVSLSQVTELYIDFEQVLLWQLLITLFHTSPLFNNKLTMDKDEM
jgi:hypothetical protein